MRLVLNSTMNIIIFRSWMLQKRKLLPPRELLNHAVQRENRLRHRRERERACRALDNPEQREERLQKRRMPKEEGQTCNKEAKDLPTRLLGREKPGCGK